MFDYERCAIPGTLCRVGPDRSVGPYIPDEASTSGWDDLSCWAPDGSRVVDRITHDTVVVVLGPWSQGVVVLGSTSVAYVRDVMRLWRSCA